MLLPSKKAQRLKHALNLHPQRAEKTVEVQGTLPASALQLGDKAEHLLPVELFSQYQPGSAIYTNQSTERKRAYTCERGATVKTDVHREREREKKKDNRRL